VGWSHTGCWAARHAACAQKLSDSGLILGLRHGRVPPIEIAPRLITDQRLTGAFTKALKKPCSRPLRLFH
jgi:hypothetical protein